MTAEAGALEEGNCEASKVFGGDSTCWVVELKKRARRGRRKVGGRAEDGTRVSSIDRLIVLLSIVKVELLSAVSNC